MILNYVSSSNLVKQIKAKLSQFNEAWLKEYVQF